MIAIELNPREVIVNPFQYGLCFAWAKLTVQPFSRIAVLLSVIAAVNTMT